MNRRSVLMLALGAIAAPRIVLAADDFPSRPVRVIMPFAAGGGPDVEMRKLAPKFGEALGQSVVVENKVGAAGILGGRVVAQAAPDGYTILYGASTFLVLKAMQPDLDLDLTTDFVPVTLTATSPTVLVVRADGPIRTFDDLAQLSKSRGGKMNYGSGGIGTAAHLTAATIVALAKIQATHIPLRGSVEIQASLQRGDTDFACPIAGTGVPLVKQGVLRALAVSSRARMKDLPQVPTLQELLGSELAVQETWFGLWAPKGAPDAAVAKLHAAAKRALADPGVAAGLEAGGSIAVSSDSPAAFGAFVKQENAKWAEIVKLTPRVADMMLDILKGVRVIDMSHVVAGPLASFYLAQLGAEVIKIESPHGEVMRAATNAGDAATATGFVALNAGKRSLAIDIRKPEGAEILRELARDADVFIENFRPGVVAKYGLDEASIRKVNPKIVYCSISGFGQEGAWAGRAAYDHIVQALTGMMMMQGVEGDAPLKVGFPVIDVAVGILGALSVVSALYARNTSGNGSYVDASMVQASMMLMYTYSTGYLSRGARPVRVGNKGYSGSPAADTYRCSDGWLSIAANTPAQFRKLTGVLGLENLCTDARAIDLDAFNAPAGGFVVPRDAQYVRDELSSALVSHSAKDMEERLSAVGVAAARVRRLGEFLDEARAGAVRLPEGHFGTGDDAVRTPGLGFRFAREPDASGAGAEALGQSARAILSELGRTPADIDRLTAAGVIRV